MLCGLFIIFTDMFLVFSRKKLIIFLLVFIFFTGIIFAGIKISMANSSPKGKITICLDAGHGGRDGGCVGTFSGVKESDLALSITKKLASYLEKNNFNVVLTRKDDGGLYGDGENKKKQDMEQRKKIINECGADCVVSIHLNSFNDSSVCGAQVFYDETDENSKSFASDVQKVLAGVLDNSDKEVKTGDFYLLKCRDVPSILVECGYLSNPKEEALLITDTYQEKVAYGLYCGILRFFNYSYA